MINFFFTYYSLQSILCFFLTHLRVGIMSIKVSLYQKGVDYYSRPSNFFQGASFFASLSVCFCAFSASNVVGLGALPTACCHAEVHSEPADIPYFRMSAPALIKSMAASYVAILPAQIGTGIPSDWYSLSTSSTYSL